MTRNFAICDRYLLLRRIILLLLLLSYLLMSTAIASVSRVVYNAPGPKAYDTQLACTSYIYVLYYNILYCMM